MHIEHLRIETPERSLLEERRLGGEALTSRYGDLNFAGLDDERALPVLIAAYNEEADLPTTLISLSRSSIPVAPIVVDNNSKDRTAEFAYELGAHVTTELKPGKQQAVSVGLAELFARRGTMGTVLLTDADVVLPTRWATSLDAGLAALDPNAPGVACGPVLYYEDGRRVVKNVALSIMALQRDNRAVQNGTMRPRGSSMALNVRGSVDTAQELLELGTKHGSAVKQDVAVVDVIRGNGGNAAQVFGNEARIIARGDRYPSLWIAARSLVGNNDRFRAEKLYREWTANS